MWFTFFGYRKYAGCNAVVMKRIVGSSLFANKKYISRLRRRGITRSVITIYDVQHRTMKRAWSRLIHDVDYRRCGVRTHE